jgi:hypothetical protein
MVEYIRAVMLPRLTSRPDLVPRQYAAAALARCNRLLRAMILLRDAGYPDVVGLPVRSLLEGWYLGMYLLLAPDEALSAINASHLYQLEHLDESWGEMTTGWDDLPVTSKLLKWKELSDRLNQLLEQSGNTTATAERLYEVLYRIESLMSIHGGLGTFSGHVVGGDGVTLSIREVRQEVEDGEMRIRAAASLVGTLARGVADSFGLSTVELSRLEAIFSAPSKGPET